MKIALRVNPHRSAKMQHSAMNFRSVELVVEGLQASVALHDLAESLIACQLTFQVHVIAWIYRNGIYD